MKKLIRAVVLLWIGTTSQLSAQQYSGPDKDIAAILANIDQFSQYYMNGETEKIVDCYTADGKIMPTGRDIMSGREALLNYWTMPEGVTVKHHKIHPEEIKVLGDEAYDYGYYEGMTESAQGQVSSWGGKYTILWKKVDGKWKMYLDMWNKRQEATPTPSADVAMVEEACNDYISTFYNADTTLAYKSIHSSLRKTGFYYKKDEGQYSEQLEMPFEALIALAKTWNADGSRANESTIRKVQVLEVSDKTAIAKVTAVWGIDYISLAKMDGKWMIVNVLWQSPPR